MDDIEYGYEQYLSEKDPDQYSTLMELRSGMETMDSDEYDNKYSTLDIEYQELLDEESSDYADGAIGVEYWDCDD